MTRLRACSLSTAQHTVRSWVRLTEGLLGLLFVLVVAAKDDGAAQADLAARGGPQGVVPQLLWPLKPQLHAYKPSHRISCCIPQTRLHGPREDQTDPKESKGMPRSLGPMVRPYDTLDMNLCNRRCTPLECKATLCKCAKAPSLKWWLAHVQQTCDPWWCWVLTCCGGAHGAAVVLLGQCNEGGCARLGQPVSLYMCHRRPSGQKTLLHFAHSTRKAAEIQQASSQQAMWGAPFIFSRQCNYRKFRVREVTLYLWSD